MKLSKYSTYLEWPPSKQEAARKLAEAGVFAPFFLGRQKEIYELFHKLKPREQLACVLSRKQGKSFLAVMLEIEPSSR